MSSCLLSIFRPGLADIGNVFIDPVGGEHIQGPDRVRKLAIVCPFVLYIHECVSRNDFLFGKLRSFVEPAHALPSLCGLFLIILIVERNK